MLNKNRFDLPFVETQKTIKNYWVGADETGEWSTDNKVGRGYADALVATCRDEELGMVLSHVVSAMIKRGRYSGIEVGFFNRIGEIASLTPNNNV